MAPTKRRMDTQLTPTTTATSVLSTTTTTTAPTPASAPASAPNPLRTNLLLPTLTAHFPRASITPLALKLLTELWTLEARAGAADTAPDTPLDTVHADFVKLHPSHADALNSLHESIRNPTAKRSAEVRALTKKRKLSKNDTVRMEELRKEQEHLLASRVEAPRVQKYEIFDASEESRAL